MRDATASYPEAPSTNGNLKDKDSAAKKHPSGCFLLYRFTDSGNVTLKVLPVPSLLVTLTVPP